MTPLLVLGSSSPAETGVSITEGDRNTCTVEVEGTYSSLSVADPTTYVPTGYEFASKTLASTGDGMGRLSINCIKYNAGQASGWTAERTTVRVDMAETQFDLITHEHFNDCRDIIQKWLATDASERGPDADGIFYYRDVVDNSTEGQEAGETETELVEIEDEAAIDFCNCYQKGITSYVRYDPVIERISYWKNPPGLSRSGMSFPSGSPTFSTDIGKWSTPPITLSGYASENFFKSKDSWVENANRKWQRTEQWVYTPDGPDSDSGFIYAVASPQQQST